MKIFYAVQATGNGHISRAMQLLPHLQEYGNVDIFLSGSNSTLQLDGPVKYRSRGLSLFYNCTGGLDFWKMARSMRPWQMKKEINELPVERYDLVINDFDYITAAACSKKNIRSVNYGHQASFLSKHTPRPSQVSYPGEWILKNYAKASSYVGLHFDSYDDFIFTPVIRQDILDATPVDNQYITVYLPSYCRQQLIDLFQPFKDVRFQIFCGQIQKAESIGHLELLPVTKEGFSKSLIHCTGIITGGGFETPAEAIHLGKKIMSIPIRSQYEQQCNAAALEKMGVTCLSKIDHEFPYQFESWMNSGKIIQRDYSQSIPKSLEYLFSCMMEKRVA